jgi:hypothetical protein
VRGVNRFTFELLRRTVVAFNRREIRRIHRFWRDHRRRMEDNGERFSAEVASRRLLGMHPRFSDLKLHVGSGPPGYLRALQEPPDVSAAQRSLWLGEYDLALAETEGIPQRLALLRDLAPESVLARTWFEVQARVLRAKALAGLRRRAEAAEQLQHAETRAWELAGVQPTTGFQFGMKWAARKEIGEAWEMLDDMQREAAIVNPAPTPEDEQRWWEGHRDEAIRSGTCIDPAALARIPGPEDAAPSDHLVRLRAARLEAWLQGGLHVPEGTDELAQETLRRVRRRGMGPTDLRCVALAYEVLGDRRRALDGWQRYILALMAMCEPDRSPLFDRAWAHVERLGGERWG